MSPRYKPTRAPRTKIEILLASYSPEHGVTNPVALEYLVRDRRLRRVIQIIESGELSTIQALAIEVDLSSSYLRHFFKAQTGVCINQMLTEQRLRRAAYHLETSNMSIKQIACMVGYEHTSSFIRAFRRCFAQTPREYRRIGQPILLTNDRFS